jgi:putative redox protein
VIDDKHRLITDEPEAIGGDGSAPAPHELLPAAPASCVSTTLVMDARTKDWDLGDVTVEVDYDHHATARTFEVAIGLTRCPEPRLGKASCGTPLLLGFLRLTDYAL